MKNGNIAYPHVCSIHFHEGKAADLYDRSHPDWAPTIAMGHSSCSVSKPGSEAALPRYERAKERKNKKRKCLEEIYPDKDVIDQGEPVDDLEEIGDADKENTNTMHNNSVSTQTCSSTCSQATQTDLTLEDLEELEKIKTSQSTLLSEPWFEEDNERVHFYSGLPTLPVLMAVFQLVSPGLPERKVLTKFQQFIITMTRLRFNLPVQDIAYRFGVHASTVSRVFRTSIHTMYTAMSFLVKWPEREHLRLTLPACFKEKFSSCAVIIDCFEVFIDRPSCLLARAQTWSSYKHHNTAKFLIGITPQGTVSFISRGWEGRTSDKYITEHCGLLKNLLPGDMVLADRGFDIEDSVGLHAARLHIPTFTKGKPQLSPFDIEKTRSLANVRIHVERVIGSVRQKYTLLGYGIIPIQYLKTDNNQPCLLDEIAFVCCALTNCCKSVVTSE